MNCMLDSEAFTLLETACTPLTKRKQDDFL